MIKEENYLQKELYDLVKTDSRFIDFLESGSLDGLWYWDLENPRHEWMSPAFWRVLGFNPDSKQHLSGEWKDLIHPNDFKRLTQNFNKHCSDPSHKYDQYVRYRHANGNWVWMRCRGIVIRGQDNRPKRMLGTHTDVTEVMNAREIKRWADQLKSLNEDLTIFSYAVSHDIKAPLNTMGGLLKILYDQAELTAIPDALKTYHLMVEKIEHMQVLLESVLVLAQIGNPDEQYEEVLLQDVVEEVLNVHNVAQEEPPIHVETENLGCISFDRSLLFRILSNLMENSIKYRKPEEKLEIKICQYDDRNLCSIVYSDNGMGVMMGQHNKIFDYFSRMHSPKIYKGHGLGLAIVRKIVEANGGGVFAEPVSADGGLKITVTFPKNRELH